MRTAALLLVLGCAATAPPARDVPVNSHRLELVEGTATLLPDGTRVDVEGVGYAHTADQKNLSTCTLVVQRGGERAELPLAREHGGSDPESSGMALGWRFTLEVADPYRRPSRAVVEAQKL